MLATQVSQNVKNEAVEEFLKGLAKNNELVKMAELVSKAGKLLVNYLISDMDINTFVYDLCRTGVEIAGTIIGSKVGKATGSFVGGGIGWIMAGPGGAVVGAEIGRIVGDFVGAVLGNIFINNALNYVSDADIFLESKRELARKIDMHTYNLAQRMTEIHYEHESEVLDGVRAMVEGMINNNFDSINIGLQKIMIEYDAKVIFDNQSEFDTFMLDDTKSIVIARK